MKIILLKIGKVSSHLDSFITDYQKRIKSFSPLESLVCKNSEQAEKWLATHKQKSGRLLICLDERGKQWTSPGLADFIKTQQEDPRINALIFLVGPPYGLDPNILKQADTLWSLSQAVFPADFAWLLLNEQVYRAFSILQGSSYHHE